jgi:hypothetical protein
MYIPRAFHFLIDYILLNISFLYSTVETPGNELYLNQKQ